MGAKRRITGDMRERLDSMVEAAAEVERNPSIWGDNMGCWLALMGFFLAAVAIMAVLYATGVIDYDFTRTPEERAAAEAVSGDAAAGAAVDVAEPGPPYMEGRQYAIYGIGEAETRRVYTFELLGDGESGAIRVWEDDTGRGTFFIKDDTIIIEMARMVPPEEHQVWEPNTFSGTIGADQSSFEGEWTRSSWGGPEGEVDLTGETETIAFEAKRL